MKPFISLALCAAIPLCAQVSIQPGVPQVGAPGAPAATVAPPPANKVLGTMDGDKLTAGDLRAMRERDARERSPRISLAGWRVYDSYLKANRVDAGNASYGEVVQLVLGTGMR